MEKIAPSRRAPFEAAPNPAAPRITPPSTVVSNDATQPAEEDHYTREEYKAGCKSAAEIAYLWVARAWVDRWHALGGSFGFVCHPDGQPKELHRGMPVDLDLWEPTDKGREDIRFRLTEERHHAGAILALEGLMEMVPGLQDAVREVGGREALTRWARREEA